jgi:hypothetical protein
LTWIDAAASHNENMDARGEAFKSPVPMLAIRAGDDAEAATNQWVAAVQQEG